MTGSATMSLRTYKSMVRKTREAYVALRTGGETAAYFHRKEISNALNQLQPALDALRVQVCRSCDSRGYFEKPDDPCTSWSCLHPAVPFYDVTTGQVDEAKTLQTRGVTT